MICVQGIFCISSEGISAEWSESFTCQPDKSFLNTDELKGQCESEIPENDCKDKVNLCF